MQLLVRNNNALNPLQLDLTNYIVAGDESFDPANPSFREATISHSLLKEGGVAALEDLKAKELIFPLTLGPFVTGSAMVNYIIELNQILGTAGAIASWQDDGMSQPTIFDLVLPQFDVEYNYRRGQRFYTNGKLRLFAQPFGHAGATRAYAAASQPGPLLMISPYASGGALAIGASTQAGVAGFGGRPQGASSGIFYPGAPSLAGDAPSLLQIAYGAGNTPTLVSLLPDGNYQPLVPVLQLAEVAGGLGAPPTPYPASTIGGFVFPFPNPGSGAFMQVFPVPYGASSLITSAWAGNHRLLALARASGTWGQLVPQPNPYMPNPVSASVGPPGVNWNLYDLGTFALQPSEPSSLSLFVNAAIPSVAGVASNACLDVTAYYMFPDNATWFCGASATVGLPGNMIVIDDVRGAQYLGASSIVTGAPSVSLAVQAPNVRITPYTRGLVPRPDPKNGLPVIAILDMTTFSHWPYGLLSAQVNVLERARYVLP